MIFPLEKTRVKSGTVLIETVLSGDSLYYKTWPNLSGVNEASFSFPICIYSGVLSILLIGLNLHGKLFSCGITNMWVEAKPLLKIGTAKRHLLELSWPI